MSRLQNGFILRYWRSRSDCTVSTTSIITTNNNSKNHNNNNNRNNITFIKPLLCPKHCDKHFKSISHLVLTPTLDTIIIVL